MYTLILSKQCEETVLIQNFLSKENCRHKVVSALSTLEREIRMGFPDFILIDSKYFVDEQKNRTTVNTEYQLKYQSYFTDIIFPVNIYFPVFMFDINRIEFTQYHMSEYQKSISPPRDDITRLLTQVKRDINISTQSSQNQFRPAEKKLYLLLKDNYNQAISLTQMSESLWGCSTDAHTKTLYSYIHRIKHILEENEYSPEWLVKEKKGYYKLAIRNT